MLQPNRCASLQLVKSAKLEIESDSNMELEDHAVAVAAIIHEKHGGVLPNQVMWLEDVAVYTRLHIPEHERKTLLVDLEGYPMAVAHVWLVLAIKMARANTFDDDEFLAFVIQLASDSSYALIDMRKEGAQSS